MSSQRPQKVISIEKLRKDKESRVKFAEFQGYLKSLPHDQLQFEADFLLGKIEVEGASDKLLTKIALLMEELATRVNGDEMAAMINEFAASVRNKLNIEVGADFLH